MWAASSLEKKGKIGQKYKRERDIKEGEQY